MTAALTDEIAIRFSANLRQQRKSAGMSQEAVGLGAALHRTEISQLERGLRVPRVDTLVKLAGAMRLANGDLLEGMAWTPQVVTAGSFSITMSEGPA